MSWNERIGRYLAEQKRQEETVQTNAEREKREGLEAKIGIVKEKVPPLLDVLEQFDCKNLLTEIRDEVWKIGEVLVQPDVTNLSPETGIGARAVLQVNWPVYEESSSGWSSTGENAYQEVYPSPIGFSGGRKLSINAIYGKVSGFNNVVYNSSCRDILLVVEEDNYKGISCGKFPTAGSDEYTYSLHGVSSPGLSHSFEVIEMTSREEVAKSLESVLVQYCAYSRDLVGAKKAAAKEILDQAKVDSEFRKRYGETLREIAKENGIPLTF